MTNATKELREAMHHTNGFVCLNNQQFTELCDAIDRKLAEQYVHLPLDMDSKPIHFGDVMQMDGDSELREVVGFYMEGPLNSGGFIAWHNGRFVPCIASLYRHATPDTWERIIEDACKRAADGYPDKTGNIAMTDLVARCKALAEKEMS